MAVQVFFHARQNTAIGHIERLGGRVLKTHGEPAWVLWLTGKRSFRIYEKATVVNLSETAITDADLVHLEKLNGLERLNLSETSITDTALVHLQPLTGLKALDLRGTEISGQGLEHLSNLTNLEYLYLSDTATDDGDLHYLNQMRKLRHLDFKGTSVSQKGVDAIMRQLPGLKVKQANKSTSAAERSSDQPVETQTDESK